MSKIVKLLKKSGKANKKGIVKLKIKAKKKNNEITEDEQKDGEEAIQKITDKFIKEIDGHVAEKEKEILSI